LDIKSRFLTHNIIQPLVFEAVPTRPHIEAIKCGVADIMGSQARKLAFDSKLTPFSLIDEQEYDTGERSELVSM
jgi:hypothetical protein